MKLKEYLKKYGLTGTGFARRCGVTTNYLSIIINGHKKPSKPIALLISLLTNGEVPPESFVKIEKKKTKKEKTTIQ